MYSLQRQSRGIGTGEARALLSSLAGDRPAWLMPVRILRRKNIAEAILLMRCVRPDAHLVVAGEASSPADRHYASRLLEAIGRFRLPVHFGVQGPGTPTVADLAAASEALVTTSVQEGFGLTLLEAAAWRRPLFARSIPELRPDLDRAGLRAHHEYDELLIPHSLFDHRAENHRRRAFLVAGRKILPARYRSEDATKKPSSSAFSQLTIEAQIEVLSHPAAELTAALGLANPFLSRWREMAEAGRLEHQTPGAEASALLSPKAGATRFWAALSGSPQPAPFPADWLQDRMARSRLRRAALYPIVA